ncbi:hypothetical protein T439DRAFT_321249 [Meredithblackwellia eburnea MCA 4105]
MKSRTLLGLAVSASVAAAQISRLATHTLPLYHRTLSFSNTHLPTIPSWTKRGIINVDANLDQAWLEIDDVTKDAFELLPAGERYQLAVGGEGEHTPEKDYSIIIADSCILFHPPKTTLNETLVLYLTSAPESHFSHFRYYTSSVEGCQTPAANDGGWLERGGKGTFTVRVERGSEVEPIQWQEVQPVVMGEDGKVVPPPKEKSFLEKYWTYILPVVLVLLLSGPAEEEGGGAKK